MVYTTLASRVDLRSIRIPDTVSGTVFKVTITPATEENIQRDAFYKLQGVIGHPVDLDALRVERIMNR